MKQLLLALTKAYMVHTCDVNNQNLIPGLEQQHTHELLDMTMHES